MLSQPNSIVVQVLVEDFAKGLYATLLDNENDEQLEHSEVVDKSFPDRIV